jgi:hypothetical protein
MMIYYQTGTAAVNAVNVVRVDNGPFASEKAENV